MNRLTLGAAAMLVALTLSSCTPAEVEARNCQRNQVDCMTDTNAGCSGGCTKSQKDCVPTCRGCYINR